MSIYVKFKKPDTLKEFIKLFFSSPKDSGDTMLNVETYSDIECKTIQCQANKFRSFDNVLELVWTYFPEVTISDLVHELLTADIRLKDGRQLYFHMSNCMSIKRIRMLYYIKESASPFEISKYDSKYSWKELLNMLNIKDMDSLKKYIKKYKLRDPNIPLTIIERINTFDDILEISKSKLEDIIPFLNSKNKQQVQQNALAKLLLIVKVYNQGKVLDWSNHNQYKYLPRFIYTKESGWSFHYCGFWATTSFCSLGLYFESEENGNDAVNK